MGYVPMIFRNVNCIYNYGDGCTREISWVEEMKYGIKRSWFKKLFKVNPTCIECKSNIVCNMREWYKSPDPPKGQG